MLTKHQLEKPITRFFYLMQIKPSISHTKHESSVIEIENISGPGKRKPSPNRDIPGPSNSADYCQEAKRQKQVTNIR